VVGEVIAVGIFLTPAAMAKSLGSAGLLLAVWTIIGLGALCGALCYGELAARFPEAGGGYAYLRHAYGRAVAFLYGWKCLLVLDPGLTAALAAGFASYAVAFIPGLSATPTAIGAILVAALANAGGLRLAAGLSHVLGIVKIGLLVFIVIWGFAAGDGSASSFVPFFERRAGSAPLVDALAGGFMAAFFSVGGFWDVSKLAGEARDPQRTLPRALTLGVLIVTLLYVMTTAVFIYLVPFGQIGSGETFVAQAGVALFGPRGGQVLSLVVLLCVGSSLLAYMTAAPRVYYAMGTDGLTLGGLGAVDPRTGAPVRAIAVQALLAIVLVAIGRFDQIVAYFVFVTVAFLALTVFSLFRFRKRTPAAAFLAPAFPLPAVGFLAMAAVVLFLLLMGNPVQAVLGVLVMALGYPVYRALDARRRTS
jgi:APA family basic amino acid/polyamine antiporter